MIGRRGLCESMWSDNAKTFKSAERKIRKLYSGPTPNSRHLWSRINQDELMAQLSSKGIKWKFIVEQAPWQGGWWDRMVRSVKEPLRKVLGKLLLSFTELTTVLVKIKAIINSRPLTTVSDDVKDDTPITPAHLAIGRSLVSLPDTQEEIEPASSKKTFRRSLYRQRLVNHFWKRWRNEYLHKLSIRYKWTLQKPSIMIRDVVLISDNVSRGKCPMGRVSKYIPERMVMFELSHCVRRVEQYEDRYKDRIDWRWRKIFM